MLFSEILTRATEGLIGKVYNSPEKRTFVAQVCLIWKLKLYAHNLLIIGRMYT